MKRKGFTLIELLAVIVVLAIIALIATPIVKNTIKNAKKGAAERTADNYIKQVETAVAEAKLGNNSIPNGTYDIDKDGNLTGAALPDGKLEIDMSGNKPTSGKITIKDNGVDQDNSNVKIGDYIVSYDKDNNKQQAQELYKGVLCKAVTTATDGNVPQGKFAYGDEYTCELGDNDTKTFFVLETNGDNVSLIMNANVGKDGKIVTSSSTDKGSVAWCSEETCLIKAGAAGVIVGSDNTKGPLTAEKALKTNTIPWTKLVSAQITLPTAYQIATAAEQSFDGENSVELTKKWIYSNMYGNVAPFGYWTSTPRSNPSSSEKSAFALTPRGGVTGGSLTGASISGEMIRNGSFGVRPVITISKSNLS